MPSIALALLFRRRETASSILAIALLVTVLSSIFSVANYVNLQTEFLERLVQPGRTYLILSRNPPSAAEDHVDGGLALKLRSLSFVERVIVQEVLNAQLTTKAGTYETRIRCVDDLVEFLDGSYINGRTPRNQGEGLVGEVLARIAEISVGDVVRLDVGGDQLEVRVVGVFTSGTQSDAELLFCTQSPQRESAWLIEFSLKEGVDERKAFDQITPLLPSGVEMIKVQQLRKFAQQMNEQTLNLLDVWSLVVYIAVVASSYVVAARLVAESSYELAMLRALGAKRRFIFRLVLTYAMGIAFLGSVLGVAMGVAGSQIVSTVLRWLLPSTHLAPFIEFGQAVKIVLLTLVSSAFGGLRPALAASRARYVEQQL
jgi:ABC-type lipoprotein release transport system permease subunit